MGTYLRMVLFLTLRLLAIVRACLKFVVVAAVIFGALSSLQETELPHLSDLTSDIKAISFDGSVWWPYFAWAAANWPVLGFGLVLSELLGLRRARSEAKALAESQRIFMATILAYLDVTPATARPKLADGEGVAGELEDQMLTKVVRLLIGDAANSFVDDAMWTFAARHGSRVRILEDLAGASERSVL